MHNYNVIKQRINQNSKGLIKDREINLSHTLKRWRSLTSLHLMLKVQIPSNGTEYQYWCPQMPAFHFRVDNYMHKMDM